MTVEVFMRTGADINDSTSRDLIDVAGQIQKLRADANAINTNTSARERQIKSDPTLSEHGRNELLSQLADERTRSLTPLKEAENKVINDKITALERRLDGISGSSQSDLIAFRDAQDRAEAIDDADRAAEVMARALRTGDKTLAHALFRAATDRGWSKAAHAFTEQNPNVAEVVKDIRKLTELRDTFGRSFVYA